MENLGLGKIITTPQQRDAIHIAVAPCIAMVRLSPGETVGFVHGSQTHVTNQVVKGFGIVDPFLNVCVREGQEFWVYLYPGSITSLRHDWTHPDFERRSEARATERAMSQMKQFDGMVNPKHRKAVGEIIPTSEYEAKLQEIRVAMARKEHSETQKAVDDMMSLVGVGLKQYMSRGPSAEERQQPTKDDVNKLKELMKEEAHKLGMLSEQTNHERTTVQDKPDTAVADLGSSEPVSDDAKDTGLRVDALPSRLS